MNRNNYWNFFIIFFLFCPARASWRWQSRWQADPCLQPYLLTLLFILHGQCQQITARTFRRLNKMFPDLPQMTKWNFVRIRNKFRNYSLKLKPTRRLLRTVTGNEENVVNIIGYFHAIPQSSTCRTDKHLTVLQDYVKFTEFSIWYLSSVSFCKNFIIRI